MKIKGVYIAPVTPLQPDGRIDFDQFHNLLEYLVRGGVDGFCIGGGTSEYPHFGLEERKTLVEEGASHVKGSDLRILASIGASSLSRVLKLGEYAAEAGAVAALLPPPHFYTYSQEDLDFFYRCVAERLSIPGVLYNLPFFTNPLESETISRLLKLKERIVGIKDSSGNLERLHQLRHDFPPGETSLIVGKDTLIFEALGAGWDAIISGLGNLCPELIVTSFRAFHAQDLKMARYCQGEVNRIADWLVKFPVPWAIREGLAVRNIPAGPFALPPSPDRAESLKEFSLWFSKWLEENLSKLRGYEIRSSASSGPSGA